jgi:ABC-type Na+ efflux pump permease subunit
MPYTALVPVPARRHPHQVLIAGLLMVSGLGILLGGPSPGSVSASLPPWLLLLWAGVITLGGAMVVAASVAPPQWALFLELAADPALSVMCVVYSAAVLDVAGSRGAVVIALVGGVAAAFAVRAVQVFRTLRAVRRQALREAGERR